MAFSCFSRRAMTLGALLLAALTLSACHGISVAPVAQVPSVAVQGDKLAPIQLDRVVFNLERGQQIGTYRGADFDVCGPNWTSKPIHWKSGKITVRDEELVDIFYREMRSAHYNVVGEPDALFGNFADTQKDAEYLIGGRVDGVSMSICDEIGWSGRRLGIQSGITSVDVTWQVFSTLDRKVVLETRTSGSAELEDGVPDGELALLVRAFAAAARNLAGDPRFHDALVRKGVSAQATAPAAPLSGWGEIAAAHPALPIPVIPQFTGGIGANMTRIQASVVTITTGLAQGSGFFVAPDLVLTNHHVARDAERLKLTLINGTEVYAKTLRSDPKRDVALLQVEGGSFTPLPLRPLPVSLTEEVYAIGSPLDESLAGTVTRGIVSQIQRDEYGLELIQADATVQPGSSGGPLLDAQGNVIGISQSGLVDSSDHSVGINFFVPIADGLRKLNIVPQ